MELQGYFTNQGLELAAKLSAGARLEITRVRAGAGKTAVSASALAKIKQDPTAGAPRRSGTTAVIPVTLAAAQAAADYSLTELGVYAKDPDKGEILYKIYRLTEPVKVSPASRLTLRFYLEETVSQDVEAVVSCSPAGLLTETDILPLRGKVEQTALPHRIVDLDASELQDFLDGLPRFMTEYLSINVSGTLETPVTLSYFSGPGFIYLLGRNKLTVRNTVKIDRCNIHIYIKDIRFEEPEEGVSSLVYVSYGVGGYVDIANCCFCGLGERSGCRAVMSQYNTLTAVKNSPVSGADVAVFAGYGARTIVTKPSGSENIGSYGGNKTGATVWKGGTITVCDKLPVLLGGSANVNSGGTIVDNGVIV